MLVIALIATVLSVELMLVAGVLYSHVPVPVDLSFVHSIVITRQGDFKPQRSLFLYGLWIMLGIGIYACWLLLTKYAEGQQKWNLKSFLIFHLTVVFLMAHSAFEAVTMDNPLWAWPVFWGAFTVGAVISVFWQESLAGISSLKNYYASLKFPSWLPAAAGCVLIFLIIFMPDLKAVVAMLYMGDYFRDWDITLTGPVYALTQGLLPSIDVNTTYGFGAVAMAAAIVHWFGGFDYTTVLAVLMWVVIIYYVLWFLLLRRFLASTLLALAAIIWGLRLQMFTLMVDPIIFIQPMTTVFRFCFDIGVFWMIWMHIQTRRPIFLALGAVFVSLGLYHMMSTGINMFTVFVFYAAASAIVPSLGGRKDRLIWRNHALAILSVPVWTALWFYLTVGTHFLEKTFWQNMTEFSTFYTKGLNAGRLIDPLLNHATLSGLTGLIYPVFCMATFLYAAGLVITVRATPRDVFAGFLAFYGLCTFTYYIVMVTSWYSMGFGGLLLVFYWISEALTKAPTHWRIRACWILFAAGLYCLGTDRLFIGYPNLLSLSRNPIVDTRTGFGRSGQQVPFFQHLLAYFPAAYKLPANSIGETDEGLKFEKDFPDDKALKKYYENQTAFPEDAALIRRLTPEGGKAAVLSSFEVLLLEHAQRKPFFYYFSLLDSRPLTGRNFVQVKLSTYTQLQKIIDQLETQKPPYIFMEKIFLTPQVPQGYFNDFGDLIVVLQYILSKYKPVETGKYLVAMKRL